MMVQHILPFTYPIITSYTQHAHLLSILCGNKNTYPWIYSNYIQIFINIVDDNHWADFYFPFPYEIRPPEYCKWISTQKLYRDNLHTPNELLDFVVENIDSKNYIHTMLNYFYIPVSHRYKTLKLCHDIMIYGYDLEQEYLYVADFFKSGYTTEIIGFNDLIKAFFEYDNATNYDYLNGMIFTYKLKQYCNYEFSVDNIFELIKSYLFSETPEYWNCYNNRNRDQVVFGVKIYTILKGYLAASMINKNKIDIRPFYLLYDHKKMMKLRFQFLLTNCYFPFTIGDVKNFSKIADEAHGIIYLLIDYNITKNVSSLSKISKILDEIQFRESEVLLKIIQSLGIQ